MKRKVIKQGHNTLTITLPAKWVEQNGVKAGDELEVDENSGQFIRISRNGANSQKKSISIDISGIDHNSIRQRLRAAYKLGFDEILVLLGKTLVTELRTGKEFPVMEVINHEVSHLLGCEVIKQDNSSCIIKNYAVDSELELHNTLRRVFLLLDEYGNSLCEQAKTLDKVSLHSMRERHFNIAKFIFYCQRLISTRDISGHKKAHLLHYIIANLDEILDIMKYAANSLLEFKGKKISREAIEIFRDIIMQNRHFYSFFYQPTKENLLALSEHRWKVRKRLDEAVPKLSAFEIDLLRSMTYIGEMYYHLCEAATALSYEQSEERVLIR